MILARYGVDLDITPDFIGLFMVWLKLVREAGARKRDNLVDICGYAVTIEEVIQQLEEGSGVSSTQV